MARESVEGSEKVAVVLHPQDLDVITEFATKLGVSFSAALRMIVRDWARRTLPQAENDRQGEM